jgi:hypothetical protein
MKIYLEKPISFPSAIGISTSSLAALTENTVG